MEKSKITIEKFKKVFLSSVIKEDGNYIDYDSDRCFTKIVEDSMKKLGEECQVLYSSEFYSVDHTFWDSSSNDELSNELAVGMKKYNWSLLALIEHENNSNDWHYEVQKLAPFHCSLRVVIGYRSAKYKDEDRLEYVSGLLQTMKEIGCFCDEGEFWVVIGNCGKGKANYLFYRYDCDSRKFVRKEFN